MTESAPPGRVALLFRESADFAARLTQRAAELGLVSDRSAGRNREQANRSELIRTYLRWADRNMTHADVTAVRQEMAGEVPAEPFAGIMLVGPQGTSLLLPPAQLRLLLDAAELGLAQTLYDAERDEPDSAAVTGDHVRAARGFLDWIGTTAGVT